MSANDVCDVLYAAPLSYSTEDSLQESIAEALQGAGMEARREVQLPGRLGRIDLMSGSVGIEVKIDGQWAAVTRQLMRYSHADEITELVLVTNRAQHSRVPREVNGKPVLLVSLVEGGL